jgi:SpoVK/Ycf46/Vps4 family AAA+-type ATPase
MSHVSMPISKSLMLPVTVAMCGLRSVLRPFVRRPDTSFVAILALREWDALPYYKTAARELLSIKSSRMAEWENSQVVTTIEDFEHMRFKLEVFDLVRAATQVVVFVPNLDDVPLKIRTLADFFGVINPPTVGHYLAAARALDIADMTKAHAEFLAEQPLESIKLAFRKGRPLINSIRRLKRQATLEAEATVAPPAKPTVTLNDMHGYGIAKDWGLRLAEDILAWQQGVIAWEDVDRGALIYGPPGCGKTTYAQALADTCGVELVIASAGRWQARGHLGDFLKAMRASFAEATKKAPSILFIDEFDSMGSREIASDGDNHDYKRQAINGLLECLDPVEGREGVVVIGATNDPKAIDPALLRPGRLEITIQIPLPDDIARVGILKQHLAVHEIAGDLAEFVASSRGWSGADIMKVARDVRRLARVRGVPLTERLLMEVMPARRALSALELRRMAVHEAGHAILCVLLSSDVLHHVYIEQSITQNGGRGLLGAAACSPIDDVIKTVESYEDRIAMMLGGIAAETLVFGNHSDGAGGVARSDLAIASDLATKIERHFGFGESLLVDIGNGARPLESLRARDAGLRDRVDERLKDQFDRATSILAKHRPNLECLVDWLMTRGRVEGDEVRALLKPVKNTASVST